jgi:hypothetical protein
MLQIWQFVLALFRDETAAFDLDPFQQIVNVNWGGGLAVEFYPEN